MYMIAHPFEALYSIYNGFHSVEAFREFSLQAMYNALSTYI